MADPMRNPAVVKHLPLPLVDGAGITTNEEKNHIIYASAQHRRESFVGKEDRWDNQVDTLVEAGLYSTGLSNFVSCFFCEELFMQFGHGRRAVDPWVEHARVRPDCGWIRLKMGMPFIEAVHRSRSRSYGDVIRVMEYGINTPETDPGVVAVSGYGGYTTDQCVVALKELDEENKQITSVEIFKRLVEQHGWKTGVHAETQSERSLQSQITEMTAKVIRLREELMCPFCCAEEKAVVVFPCGHMCSCAGCMLRNMLCTQCRGRITGASIAIVPKLCGRFRRGSSIRRLD